MEPAPPNGEPPEETSPDTTEPQPELESPPEPPSPPKGFPVTFSGVASFAETGWGRLLGWQFLMALALGGAVLLVLARHWAPVVDSAMAQLPAETGWRNGTLVWPDEKPVELGRNNYFCLIVDPAGTARQGQLADVQVELRREDWLLGSVFGYFELNYAPGDLPLLREELAPWWGARRPFLLLALGAAAGALVWLGWLALGAAGGVVARAVAFYVDRQCNYTQGWRLAAAAQLPSALLLAVGVLCYALGLLPWMGLLVLVPLAALVAWAYLFFAPFFLPRIEAIEPNPFDGEEEETNAAGDESEFSEPEEANPFQDDEDGDDGA
ncbi:MAG TPA: hypothetical protein EYG19_09360 [Verrucomicrobia bacterium]|nr:hypothetical protein [Verrucomicrobiota bacterium]